MAPVAASDGASTKLENRLIKPGTLKLALPLSNNFFWSFRRYIRGFSRKIAKLYFEIQHLSWIFSVLSFRKIFDKCKGYHDFSGFFHCQKFWICAKVGYRKKFVHGKYYFDMSKIWADALMPFEHFCTFSCHWKVDFPAVSLLEKRKHLQSGPFCTGARTMLSHLRFSKTTCSFIHVLEKSVLKISRLQNEVKLLNPICNIYPMLRLT